MTLTKKLNLRFTIETCPNHGITGIMPNRFKNVGWDSYIPSFAVAHEMIEHGAGEFGAVFQEYQALGAVLFVRGWEYKDGYYAGTSRAEHYGSEMVDIYQTSSYEWDERLLRFPKFPKFSLSWDEKRKFKKFFQTVKQGVIKAWNEQVNDDCEYICELCDDCQNCEHGESFCENCRSNWLLENWENVKTSIMFGYYKSKRRWDNFNVQSLRDNIEREIKSKEKMLEGYNETGAEFSLQCEVTPYGSSAEIVSISSYNYI